MDRKALALVAGLLAAAVGLFFLWHGVGSSPSDSKTARDAAGAEAKSEPGPDAGDRSRLEVPASIGREETRNASAQNVSDSAARSETFPLAEAGWIEGTVRFPKNAPDDETLQVWAFEDALARGVSPSENDLPTLVRSGRIEKGWWSRRPIEASGAFKVPVPKGAAAAAIVLDGHFLYLEKIAHVDLKRPAVALILEPELGAWIVGRCTLPAEASPEDSPVGADVKFRGTSISDPFGQDDSGNARATVVGRDLAFELRGVPIGMDSTISVSPRRLMATDRTDLKLLPGRKLEIDIALRFGARVSGMVVDDSGAGLENAIVEVSPPEGAHLEFTVLARFEQPQKTAVDGTFELYGLPPGKTWIRARLNGYLDGRSAALELTDRDVRTGISIELSRGHSVSGKVTWPDGSPAAGASVTVAGREASEEETGRNLRPHRRGGVLTARGKTAENGEFSISGLDQGPLTLTAKAYRELGAAPPEQKNVPGENLPSWTAERSEVAVDTQGIALVLREPIGFAGNVVDDLGAPVKNFAISARPIRDEKEPSRIYVATTLRTQTFETTDGSFQFTGLQPGRWMIEAKAGGYVQIEDKPEVDLPRSGEALVVRLVRAASASGVVLDPDGQPIARAEVRAGKGGRGAFSSDGEKAMGETDSAGAFLVADIPPGNIQLSATAKGFAPSEPWPMEWVAGQRVDDIVLHLRRGGRLTGEVYDERGGRAVGRGVMVMSMSAQDQRNSTVDAEGNFLFESLAPGAYQVIVMPTESEQQKMAEDFAGPSAEEKNVDPDEMFSKIKMASAQIREGETTHVILGAPPRAPVHVFGKVTRAGEVVTSGTILCISEGGSLLSKMKMGSVRETGDYSLTLDEPGAVVLTFQGDLAHGGTNEFHATIPADKDYRLDLDLPTGGLRGVVRGPDSAPLAMIEVTLRQGGGHSSLSSMGGSGNATTDASGGFEFNGLAPGTYGLSAGGNEAKPDGEMNTTDPPWGRTVRSGIDVGKDKITEGVELRLTRPSRITGIVRETTGRPLANAVVFVRDESGEILHRFSGVTTDAGGRFVYRGIADGRYVLFARTKTLVSPESAPVSVREGGSAEVDLTAVPGTTLLISVEDKDGTTLHASFSVRDEHGREMAEILDMGSVEGLLTQGISSTEDRVGPLPPGEYKVTATTFDGRSASKTVKLRGQDERGLKLRIE